MKKIFSYIFLICLLLLVGCNELSKYDDEDVAAIIRGEELTIGELRFLYPDDKVLENLDGTIKAKLVKQEVKAMNIDVSKELQEIEEKKSEVDIYSSKEVDTETANGMREFSESQSAKFEMEPEKYHEEYLEMTQETTVYLVSYIEAMIGDGMDDPETENQLLNDLVEDNKAEIQIFIE